MYSRVDTISITSVLINIIIVSNVAIGPSIYHRSASIHHAHNLPCHECMDELPCLGEIITKLKTLNIQCSL